MSPAFLKILFYFIDMSYKNYSECYEMVNFHLIILQQMKICFEVYDENFERFSQIEKDIFYNLDEIGGNVPTNFVETWCEEFPLSILNKPPIFLENPPKITTNDWSNFS